MYFLPLAWLMARTAISLRFRRVGHHNAGIIHNLVPVTLAISSVVPASSAQCIG
jgi:hypothetical protein